MNLISDYEYLLYNKDSESFSAHEDEIKLFNKVLIEKYPWLGRRVYDDKTDSYIPDPEEDYLFTWLDDMPDGWRLEFGRQMCEELQQELERINFVDGYVILQVKEKYGSLRWYTGGVPSDSKLFEIVDKYETLSESTCIECGKPAEWMSTGWISPYCPNCKNKLIESGKMKEEDFTEFNHV